MAILNVTPDSFSDGGRLAGPQHAIELGLEMVADGADWVDVGGESTRPGAASVSADEEIDRIASVVAGLAQEGVKISIDTQKPEVASEALRLGASWVNDVSGLRDPEMFELVASQGCRVCIMHMQGTPQTMQRVPSYLDVDREVWSELEQRAERLTERGVQHESIFLDPGFGFGKTLEHNLTLLRRLGDHTAGKYPVLVGLSRKSFLGAIPGFPGQPLPPLDRYEVTLAAQTAAHLAGAACLRVHDVTGAVRCRAIIEAMLSAQ